MFQEKLSSQSKNDRTTLEYTNQIHGQVFTDIFIDGYKNTFFYLLRRTGNWQDAEDLVQETYLEAFSSFSAGHYQEQGKPEAYIVGIAKNVYRDWKKGKTIGKEFVVFEENDHTNGNHTDEEAIIKTRVNALFIAINCLPSSQQDAIFYKIFTGLSEKEIAEMMGKSIGAVKQCVFRARESIKHLLKNHPYG